MAEIRVLREQCIGCEACVVACPFGQIAMVDQAAQIGEGCTLCGSCVEACPIAAIELTRAEQKSAPDSGHSGIWVFAEQQAGQPRSVVLELLGAAQRLASTKGCPVSAVLLGHNLSSAIVQLIAYGADQVLVADHPALERYNDELYADLLASLIQEHRPEIVLLGATAYGRSLAPRVASRLGTGLTADCTELSIDQESGLLLQTRPAFGGNLMATIVCPQHRPQMATVRPRVMRALEPDFSRKGLVIPVPYQPPRTLRTRVLEVFRDQVGGANLADASVVVAVGKGIGSAANLPLFEQLAAALGGVVGATRPVVDAGWVSYSQQIGQTGKTVAPKLYIACGISGAVQHLAGMSSAETIVAINKDPEAPIFKLAHHSLVGDVLEIVPELLRQLEQRA
jgi:electron transfer flavoprotein alpha subunit